MSWLYDRTKTLEQLERAYYQGVKEDVEEAVKEAFDAEPLTAEEREALLTIAEDTGVDLTQLDGPAGAKLGAMLIPLINDSGRAESIEERLHEAAESAVIYTADVALMLLMSSNDDAYETEIGEKPETDEARAAFAYVADARELLSNEYFMTDIAKALLGGAK